VSRFLENAIAHAGLSEVLEARRAGDLDRVRTALDVLARSDLLVLGAVADLIRSEEVGADVRIHVARAAVDVDWVAEEEELGLLRAVALARIVGPRAARIGVDWSRSGLELAQVALGFGASELAGPITRKNGLLVLDTESRKVKGKGNVPLVTLQRQNVAALVRNAGRVAVFTDELGVAPARAEELHA
jgi:hypothetical protein